MNVAVVASSVEEAVKTAARLGMSRTSTPLRLEIARAVVWNGTYTFMLDEKVTW